VIVLALAAALTTAQPPDSAAPGPRAARAVDSLPPDRWLGADKIKHFFVSGAVYAFSFAGTRAAGLDRQPAMLVSIAPTALIGLGKEARDRRVTGRFSARDLVADALGAAVYAAILARTAR
jgi:uncharacterized protein YfiM (DUF2279 family)